MDDSDDEFFSSALKKGGPNLQNTTSESKSFSQAGTYAKKFKDFDEDNPLAGILSDEDDTPPPRPPERKDRKSLGDVLAPEGQKIRGSEFGSGANVSQVGESATGGYTPSSLDFKGADFQPPGVGRSAASGRGQPAPSFGDSGKGNRGRSRDGDDLLDLLGEDTKQPLNLLQGRDNKKKIISDIFADETDKAPPIPSTRRDSRSYEPTEPTSLPSRTSAKGAAAADWLGLKESDPSDFGLDSFPSGLGDAGRRPRTAAEPAPKQEARPKTAAVAAASKPRPLGRSEKSQDDQKTPQSILKAFMTDLEGPLMNTLSSEARESEPPPRAPGYTPSAAREPRRAGRRSSTGPADPLGLFSSQQADQAPAKADTTPQQSGPKAAAENPIRTAPTPTTSIPASVAPSSQIPSWLGGSAAQATTSNDPAATAPAVSSIATASQGLSQQATSATVQTPSAGQPTVSASVADPGSLLTSLSQMEAGYSEVMAQQMQGLTAALSFRRQEEAMAAIQMRQAALISQYEHQLNELVDRQIQRQKQMELNMAQQQEQIQKHVQALISQPTNPHPFITHSQLFMPKQPTGESPAGSSPDSTDAAGDLKHRISRLEWEKAELEAQIEKDRKRFVEHQMELEEVYRKQVAALETALEKQEKRMFTERQELEKEAMERLARLKEEHVAASNQQAERMAALHAEWLSDLRRLGEFHKEAVDMLRSEQTSAIEHWNEMKTSELNLIRDSASNTQALKQAIGQLHESTDSIQEIKAWFSQKENKQNQESEISMQEREARLTALQQTLDREIASVNEERVHLNSLARELEVRLGQQKEDADKLAKAAETRENAWREEQEETRKELKAEKQRVQELQNEIEAEIKRLSAQKSALSDEVARLEVTKKLTEDNISQRTQEIQKMEEEAKKALSAAQEKSAEAKRERELADSEQRVLQEQRTHYGSKAQDLDTLSKKIQLDTLAAEETRAEGIAALAEARRLEREHADHAVQLERQIVLLKEREQLLCQEKLSLSMEWKRLRENRARGLCLQCSQHISSHHGNNLRQTPPKDFVDPLPIIMRLRAERGSDYSDMDFPDRVPSVLDVISQ